MPEQDLYPNIEKAIAILKSAGAVTVYLFGSAVYGTLRPDSDVDFAVTGLRPELFYKVLGQAEDILQRHVDLVDLDIDTPFTRYLRQKGKLQHVA